MGRKQQQTELPETVMPAEMEVDGRHYYHEDTGVLVTRGRRDDPPGYYHASSPDPNDPTGTHRLFWIFVGAAFVIGTGLWVLYQAGLLNELAKTL